MRRPAPVPKDMQQLVRLFTQIALLRRGPQDLPPSALLLVLTLAGYLAVNALVSALLPPVGGWPLQLLVDTLFTLVWYVALLQLVGRPERILQTSTAVFGLQAVLSPPLIASEWLMRRFGQDAMWQLPIALAGFALLVWLVAANGHVVKAALEWSGTASIMLVILQLFCGQLLLFALFPVRA
jgi:hypothetical protein